MENTTPATLSFQAATDQRRSLRSLDSTAAVLDAEIVRIVEDALRVVPSAFNSQTTRTTVLLGDEHRKLWTITGDALANKIGAERYNEGTKGKIEAFAAARGSILFWDDLSAVESFRETCPKSYKDKVDEWVHQGNGMMQYHIWVAVEAFGLGANLQHYNPLIDEAVRQQWGLSSAWALRAQLVFGTVKEGGRPGERVQKYPVETRTSTFGASM